MGTIGRGEGVGFEEEQKRKGGGLGVGGDRKGLEPALTPPGLHPAGLLVCCSLQQRIEIQT